MRDISIACDAHHEADLIVEHVSPLSPGASYSQISPLHVEVVNEGRH